MATAYFEYPAWQGRVYGINARPKVLAKGALALLPCGTWVRVTVSSGYLPKAQIAQPQDQDFVYPVNLVIDTGDFEQEFKGTWDRLVECINAAAAVNTLFTVLLTPEEYARLSNNGLKKMKHLFSERAFSLLQLYEHCWHDPAARPALELLRTGSCP